MEYIQEETGDSQEMDGLRAACPVIRYFLAPPAVNSPQLNSLLSPLKFPTNILAMYIDK